MLHFGERDVWSATCSACAETLVGERTTGVIILKVQPDSNPISPSHFDQLKKAAADGWKSARVTGRSLVVGGHTIDVVVCPDHSMQSALSAHLDVSRERAAAPAR